MTQSTAPASTLKLEDFGLLQARYQALPLKARANAALHDAAPALETAERVLSSLAKDSHSKNAFQSMRRNAMLMGRMRPSEAKNLLTDTSSDFIEGARHKLAAWRKTLERIAAGEDVEGDHIPQSAPIALAIIGTAGVSHYLSVIPLVLTELCKLNEADSKTYQSHAAHMRRCATILSDCEIAMALDKAVK